MQHDPSHTKGNAQSKLLIVDDEEKIRHLLTEFFSVKGYEVRAVAQGEEAIALTRVFCPDVVVLDLLLPGMSGIETLKVLKTLTPTPKVLILSGADHEEVARGAVQLGADFYMCKPANLHQLEYLVNGLCPTGPLRH